MLQSQKWLVQLCLLGQTATFDTSATVGALESTQASDVSRAVLVCQVGAVVGFLEMCSDASVCLVVSSACRGQQVEMYR